MILFTEQQQRLSVTVVLMGLLLVAIEARAGGSIGANSFGGARLGTTGVFTGGHSGPPVGSSIITHGGTGFTIYNQQGVTRVIGQPQVSKNIRLPGGGSALAIGDGAGGVHLFGAGGNHRILGNSRLFAHDGP